MPVPTLKTAWRSLGPLLGLPGPAAARTLTAKEDTMAVNTAVARDDSYRLEVGYATLSSISGQVFDTRPSHKRIRPFRPRGQPIHPCQRCASGKTLASPPGCAWRLPT
jgi:hypothetical protein